MQQGFAQRITFPARQRVRVASLRPSNPAKEAEMARYARSASKDVKGAMQKRKSGTLKSSSGRKVKSRKQAVAIGLSEARRKGKKVPPKRK
jgi:hypothetical protein